MWDGRKDGGKKGERRWDGRKDGKEDEGRKIVKDG